MFVIMFKIFLKMIPADLFYVIDHSLEFMREAETEQRLEALIIYKIRKGRNHIWKWKNH